MAAESTKVKLLKKLDDMMLIGRAMFDTRMGPVKDPVPMDELGDLAINNQKEINQLLDEAAEQAKLQKEMDQLRAEVEEKDRAIKELQRGLRTAEQQLIKDISQASLKLSYVRQAQTNPVNSEDLIRYAHRVSASHGFTAPYNWQPGDQRRPYPTDFEMRQGFLGQQSSYTDHMAASRSSAPATETNISAVPTSSGSVSYTASSEVTAPVPSHTLELRGHNKENENLDQSASDTSSSSSSDEATSGGQGPPSQSPLHVLASQPGFSQLSAPPPGDAFLQARSKSLKHQREDTLSPESVSTASQTEGPSAVSTLLPSASEVGGSLPAITGHPGTSRAQRSLADCSFRYAPKKLPKNECYLDTSWCHAHQRAQPNSLVEKLFVEWICEDSSQWIDFENVTRGREDVNNFCKDVSRELNPCMVDEELQAIIHHKRQ